MRRDTDNWSSRSECHLFPPGASGTYRLKTGGETTNCIVVLGSFAGQMGHTILCKAPSSIGSITESPRHLMQALVPWSQFSAAVPV